jgi:hypothetical protein
VSVFPLAAAAPLPNDAPSAGVVEPVKVNFAEPELSGPANEAAAPGENTSGDEGGSANEALAFGAANAAGVANTNGAAGTGVTPAGVLTATSAVGAAGATAAGLPTQTTLQVRGQQSVSAARAAGARTRTA